MNKEGVEDDSAGDADTDTIDAEEAEDDMSKEVELTEGTATTTHASGDGHQAFQENVQSNINRSPNQDGSAPDDMPLGQGDADTLVSTSGQLDGQGVGDNDLSNGEGLDDGSGADGNEIGDPNPL